MLKLVAMFTAALASAPAAVCAGDLTGQEIRIGVAGPLTTPSATFGVEMRQAVDLAIDERNGAGGLLGGKVVAEVIDDQADAEKGKAAAKALCDDPRVLAVVGHVNSGVMLASEKVYADCGLPIVTPMASNPAITEQGLANVFRLTNRDDHKGPGLARWLTTKMGKKAAVVVDDGTPYGKGLADQFANGFPAAGRRGPDALDNEARPDGFLGRGRRTAEGFRCSVLRRHQGRRLYPQGHAKGRPQLRSSPAATAAGASAALSSPRRPQRRRGRASASSRPRPHSARSPAQLNSPSVTRARFGPINNYAASSYDSARVVMSAIEAAATKKGGMPDRADVLAALKDIKFQGVAYAAPEAFDAKGDNIAAVIFVNDVDGDRFREIDQIGGER